MDNLFVIHKLKELLAIDSPLGMHREMDEYLLHQAEELGFAARRTVRRESVSRRRGRLRGRRLRSCPKGRHGCRPT